MIIREATRRDAAAIRQLLIQLGYPNLEEDAVAKKIILYNSEHYKLLVGEVDHVVVGFISLHWFHIFHSEGMIGRISSFCVDESFRSQGFGRQLLEAAEFALVNEGCKKIEVTSNIRRIRTHEFYLARGYQEDSRRFTKYYK